MNVHFMVSVNRIPGAVSDDTATSYLYRKHDTSAFKKEAQGFPHLNRLGRDIS